MARCGAVARAAAILGRTQPSVSARLASLEAAWGTRLFRRLARGMVPTPEGARLLPMAEAILRELEELDWSAGLPVSHAGELRLGAGDALARELLPKALATLLDEQPGVDVQLREGTGPRLLEALRDGEIDLALVVLPSTTAPGLPDGVEVRPLVQSEVALLVPPGKGRQSARALPLRSLEGQPLVVLQTGSAFRRHLEAAFGAARVAFRPAVEVGNLSLVRRFVAAGLGVAPVPNVAFSRKDALTGVDRRRLGGVAPVTYHRAVRSGIPLSNAVHRLLELLATH